MEQSANQKLIYQFGKFILDPQEKTLFSEGVPVHLPAKEFETLLLLVENNGRALSKEEMLEAVWHDTYVEENNLSKYVSRLRKLLNTNGQEYIETLPKHGYRFSADISRTFQPAEETILEKRTIQRLTVKIEEDFEETPRALPSKTKSVFRPIVLTVFVLIGLAAASWVWSWQQPEQPVNPDESGIIVLTDGRYDDNGAIWTNQGQIYFFRNITNTRVESWTMNADGSDQRRANTEIKNLLQGRWSPDGNKAVFWKEGDNKTMYLADANGANEIALPFIVGNMDWSPDGSQFVYQARESQIDTEIFLYTLKLAKSVNLTNNNTFDADPSFSPDGTQIAFVSGRDGNPEIYVMNADGSNVRRLTNHPAFDNYPVFSPDGTAVAFQSNRENERTEVYLQNLGDDAPPAKISNLNGETGIAPKCWSADGTQILLWTDQNGKGQILLAMVEPFPARLILSDDNADLSFPSIAPDGRQILYQARLADRSLELRLTDLETRATVKIFKTEPNLPLNTHLSPAWSPNGSRIAFSSKTGGNSEIFTVKTDGSDLQNLTNDPLLDTSPVFSPDGSEIIFTRDYYGKAYLYRMNLDGGNQRRVTEKDGYEMTSSFSPDGVYLAFAGDRELRGLEIFLLDLKNPSDEKLLAARRFHDSSPVFSPDGRKIAFIATSDGNQEIYLMNRDGTGLFRLTHSKTEETAPQFSKDGKTLIFAGNQNGKFAIYEIELP